MTSMLNRSSRSMLLVVACLAALGGCGPSGSGDKEAGSMASAPPGSPASEAAPAEVSPPETADASVPAPGDEASGCDAAPVRDAIGKAFTEALGEDVRARSGSKVLRALKPGDVVTMEFRFDRVNLALDDKGVVTAVTCG
jgi:hypothetical protein